MPGTRPVTTGKGPEWGLAVATPIIVKYRDERTDARTALEAALRLAVELRTRDSESNDKTMKSSFDAVAFARALINIDSTTGREAEAGQWLSRELRELGYTVVEQPVDGGRANVFATIDPPDVVFSTHYDCVPPFFPSRVENGRLYGRGACDAKGILAAQVAAAERLRASGERRVGLLFVVGEERGSDGAAAANLTPRRLAVPDQRRADGQPAGNRHARRAAAAVAGGGTSGAFGDPGARRVGDRQADRCARGASVDRAAVRSGARVDVSTAWD